MKALTNLDVHGEFAGSFKSFTSLPENPKAGQWALIQNRVSVCIEIEDGKLPVWFPITNEGNQVEHNQTEPETIWNINHKLGSNTVIVQCFDDASTPIRPDEIEVVDENNVQVKFSTPLVGRTFVLYGTEQGSEIEQRTYDNKVEDVGSFKFESISVNKSLKTFFGKLTSGHLISWGFSQHQSRGLGVGGVDDGDSGYTILDLPYTTAEVKQYGCQHLSGYALMDSGDLYVWGENSAGQCGVGSKSNVPYPKLSLQGVAEVLHQNYTIRGLAAGERYTLVKMLDGSYMITGFTGNTGWTEELNKTSWQLLRLPEGVEYSDIKYHYFNGYGSARAFFIQTNDLKVYSCGRNYYGQLGVSEGVGVSSSVDWTLIAELEGKEIKHIAGQYGWSNYKGDGQAHSSTYVLTTDNKLYHAGTGYNSGHVYLTGHPTESNPVTAANKMLFVLIQEDVEFMDVLGSPAAVVIKRNGEWFGFGHNSTYHRLTGENSAATVELTSLGDVPSDVKLVPQGTTYTESWRQPTAFYDDEFLYLRGANNSGCMGLGDKDTRKELEVVNYVGVFDGKIKQISYHGYSASDCCLVLTEHGTLYVAGYGGRGAFYIVQGNTVGDMLASYATWQRV